MTAARTHSQWEPELQGEGDIIHLTPIISAEQTVLAGCVSPTIVCPTYFSRGFSISAQNTSSILQTCVALCHTQTQTASICPVTRQALCNVSWWLWKLCSWILSFRTASSRKTASCYVWQLALQRSFAKSTALYSLFLTQLLKVHNESFKKSFFRLQRGRFIVETSFLPLPRDKTSEKENRKPHFMAGAVRS